MVTFMDGDSDGVVSWSDHVDYFTNLLHGNDDDFNTVIGLAVAMNPKPEPPEQTLLVGIGKMYGAANHVSGRVAKFVELFAYWDIDGNGEAGKRELTAYCMELEHQRGLDLALVLALALA